MTRLFARHSGRHCRRWWARTRRASDTATVPADDFSRPRAAPVPLSAWPLATDLYPYSPKDAA